MGHEPADTVREFTEALRSTNRPGGRALEMLRTHAAARARLMTATTLADRVGYDGYRAVNLQYGLLAARLGKALPRRSCERLATLVEFVPPNTQTNGHWQMRMKEAFAVARVRAGWI
jgi:hypothetical protein